MPINALQTRNNHYDMPGLVDLLPDPELMAGEIIAYSASASGAYGNIFLDGVLFLTNARLIFVASSVYANFLSCPLLCIDNVEMNPAVFKVHTKDPRSMEFNINS